MNTYSEDTSISNESISSTGTDENAILVTNQANVSLDNVTIDRTSSDSTGGDSSSFYGVGAAVLATDGTVNISNSTITTNASGGAGIFAYGDGVANVSDTTINTTQDTSGGIHVAGGGTLHATNLTVETNGGSAAAIRSDRGGGTMTVNGGSYTSNGSGSPAVYCTADIEDVYKRQLFFHIQYHGWYIMLQHRTVCLRYRLYCNPCVHNQPYLHWYTS